MADDVLSQNEIDALLSAISSGEMDADELKKEEKVKKVRTYDFKRALRFSKDQIRSISRIHENFARLLTNFFSAQLRTYVNISVATVDQIPYEEFIRSIPKMTILNTYSVAPLEGKILMETNPNVAYGILDRVLGGKGANINKIDNLTEIEKMLMTQLFEKSIVNLQEAWSSLVDIDPLLEDFEVNPQFLRMVSPNETVVIVSLDTTIGEASGMINICIPHIVLEPVIPKLSVHYQMQTTNKKPDPKVTAKIEANLQQAHVESKAILGSTDITIQQFLHLAKDDLIKLDQSIDDPLIMMINDEPKFYVQPGTFKSMQSIQILEELKREDNHNE